MRAIAFEMNGAAVAPGKIKFDKANARATRQAQNQLLDTVIEKNGLRKDADLAKLLEVAPPVISKIRRGRLPVGATLAVAITEVTDLEIADIVGILAGAE